MVKSKDKQVQLLDQVILPLFGFRNLSDHDHILTKPLSIPLPDLIPQLNRVIPLIKQCFPVKSFNFYRTHDQVTDYPQAFALLKKCLELAQIPFELSTRTQEGHKNKCLRLFQEKQSISSQYIKIMEKSSGRTFVERTVSMIPYQQYMGQLTSYETQEYRVPIDINLKDTGVSYVLTLGTPSYPFLKGWVKELGITLIPEIPSRSCYEILIGSNVIHKSMLSSTNLIPHGVVLPMGLSRYHESELKFYFNQPITGDLVIRVVKSTVTPLLNDDEPLYIRWGQIQGSDTVSDNYLTFVSGMGGVRYDNGWVSEEPHLRPIPTPSPIITRTEVQFGQYRICHLSPVPSPQFDFTQLLKDRPDLDALRYSYQSPFNQQCYYETMTQQLIFHQPVPKVGDTLTHWVITFDQPIPQPITIYLRRFTLRPISYQTTDHQHFHLTSFDDDYMCNVIYDPELTLMIQIPIQATECIPRYTYQLEMITYHWSDHYRHQLLVGNSVSKLVKQGADTLGIHLSSLKPKM